MCLSKCISTEWRKNLLDEDGNFHTQPALINSTAGTDLMLQRMPLHAAQGPHLTDLLAAQRGSPRLTSRPEG